MSDPFGTPHGAGGPSSSETVHEAYSFACMRCGHGWEQSFEIAHHTDEHGHTSVIYHAEGRKVPSPLTRPSCPNCGGHLVRIMRSGRVESARWGGFAGTSYSARASQPPSATSAPPPAGWMFEPVVGQAHGKEPAAQGDSSGEEQPSHRRHHWLADFLAFFHHRPAHDDSHDDSHHDRAA